MRRPVLTLILLSALTLGLGLGRPAITDSDEAFYAEAAREMVESGDWLTPHFNYHDRFEKPVLYYWLTAATYLAAGPTEWAARLWSAFSGVGLVLLTRSIATRYSAPTASRDAGWLAGAIVATCFGCAAMARWALPDLPLAFCITLCITSALEANLGDSRGSTRAWLLCGFAAALGFLMKGPVAVVVPALVLAPIWWRERAHVTGLVTGLSVAALVFAVVGLPWYLAMWSEHGTKYLEGFFLDDNLKRFTTAQFNERRIPGNYLAVLVGGFFPWSAYLVALPARSLTALWRGARTLTREEWRLVIWILAPLVFFSVSVGQQPRYILPLIAPLAALLASAICRRVDEAAPHPRVELRWATWITAGLLVAVAVALIRVQPLFVNAYPLAFGAGATVTVLSAVALAVVALRGAWQRLPVVLVGVSALLILTVQLGVLAGKRPEPVEAMARLVAAQRLGDEPVAVYQVFVRNLVFYTGRKQVELYDVDKVVQFLNSPERVLLVIRRTDLDELPFSPDLTVRTLATVPYLNTANLKLGTLLAPDPSKQIETALLVTNR